MTSAYGPTDMSVLVHNKILLCGHCFSKSGNLVDVISKWALESFPCFLDAAADYGLTS